MTKMIPFQPSMYTYLINKFYLIMFVNNCSLINSSLITLMCENVSDITCTCLNREQIIGYYPWFQLQIYLLFCCYDAPYNCTYNLHNKLRPSDIGSMIRAHNSIFIITIRSFATLTCLCYSSPITNFLENSTTKMLGFLNSSNGENITSPLHINFLRYTCTNKFVQQHNSIMIMYYDV